MSESKESKVDGLLQKRQMICEMNFRFQPKLNECEFLRKQTVVPKSSEFANNKKQISKEFHKRKSFEF